MDTHGRVVINDGVETKSFFAIPVDSLPLDTILDFALFKVVAPEDMPAFQSCGKLYWRPGEVPAPFLYQREHLPFTDQAREELRAIGVTTLLVDDADAYAYNDHLYRNLLSILGHPSALSPTGAFVLYHAACGLMHALFVGAPVAEPIRQCEAFVHHAVEFIIGTPRPLPMFAAMMPTAYESSSHSVNVFAFSLCLAQHLRLPPDLLKRLGLGALLHDIGLSRVSSEALAWRGRLNGPVLREVQSHAMHGVDILREWGVSDDVVLDIVHHHHERLDGSGYPDQLGAAQMDISTRIVAVTDRFDTVTTSRPGRQAATSFNAFRHMRYEMATQLSQEIVTAFIHVAGTSPR
ncbi:MAG TPA: HD domain-containing protein [Candidatus Hydrogenedentes bacterium]|nr:HD domain-containing protein [Candidatus Hydrogenedentota bacterium]HPG66034.1 HD domain-containing protein [Candidatus Hydrogenedentota bacterium]